MVLLLEIKSFFFRGMLSGWAASGKRITISEMPGYKAIPYSEGKDLYFLDCWCSGPGTGKSSGTTTIWSQGTPVWVMHYGGWYRDKGTVLFVKRALLAAYEASDFFGGRGPDRFTDHNTGMTYRNFVRPDDFAKFGGAEEVQSREGKSLGYHDYWGMSLL